jgi:NarL family two-component system response regulator LiaR
MSLTIVVADDQELIRKGLAALLGYESDFDVLDCGSVRRVLQLVARQLPQVVILDTTLSGVDVIDTTKHIKSLSPGTRVVVLSSYLDEIFVRTLIEAGIGGYVLKSDPACDLIEAIRAGNVRDVYLSHEVAAIVRREDASPINFATFRTTLSPRQKEILRLIAEGYSSKSIAAKFGICESTVKSHRKNIMEKLGIHDRVAFTRHAIHIGLTRVK